MANNVHNFQLHRANFCQGENIFFFRYTRKGVLVYVINKKTGDKVGCYKNLDEVASEFYDMKDIRVDSMDTNLPYDILQFIREIFQTEKQPNKFINEKVWNESHSRYQELQLMRGIVEHTNAIMETEVPNEMRTMDVVNWDVVNFELNQGEFWAAPVSA